MNFSSTFDHNGHLMQSTRAHVLHPGSFDMLLFTTARAPIASNKAGFNAVATLMSEELKFTFAKPMEWVDLLEGIAHLPCFLMDD